MKKQSYGAVILLAGQGGKGLCVHDVVPSHHGVTKTKCDEGVT